MFQRYLSFSAVPELRPDPIESEKVGNEIEVVIPIDVYWEIEEVVKNMRYARIHGNSTKRLWAKFAKLMFPCIVAEKDRYWFKRNVPK